MSFAYSVAIRLSVANLASQGIRLIAKDLLAAHGAAVGLQGKLSALKLAAVGYGLDKMGAGIFHGLEKTVSAAREYTNQLALMNAAGMSQVEIAHAVGAAWSTSRQVVSTTAEQNLRSIRELRSLFGTQHMAEAYTVLPTVARTEGIMDALTGHHSTKLAFEMAKVAELRQTGVMTLPFLQRNMDELSRALLAMGGTITASDYLMTMKYAKTAALSLNDRFVYDYLPTLIQEVKAGGGGLMGNASQAGTALMTLYSTIVQGVVKKAAVPIWLATGLIKPSDIVRNATGGWQIRPGAVQGAQLFQQNPFEWAQMVRPQLERYAKAHHMNMLQLISTMFTARNAQWMMNTLIAKAPQFERDRQLIESTPGNYDAYKRLLKTSPLLAQEALSNQWQNILAILGFQILPKLIPLMLSFTDDLNSLAGWIQKHPKLTEGLVIGLGGVALALSLIGKVMMSVALIKFLGLGATLGTMFRGIVTAAGVVFEALGGWVVTALVAAGLGAYELWKHWDSIWPKVKSIWSDIESAATAIPGEIKQEWNALLHWFRSPETPASAVHGPSKDSALYGAYNEGMELRAWFDRHFGTGGPSYVATRQAATVVHTQVNIDGKKVAQATTRHVAAALGAPQTGSAFFDGRGALVPAGGVQDY